MMVMAFECTRDGYIGTQTENVIKLATVVYNDAFYHYDTNNRCS